MAESAAGLKGDPGREGPRGPPGHSIQGPPGPMGPMGPMGKQMMHVQARHAHTGTSRHRSVPFLRILTRKVFPAEDAQWRR